MAGFSWQELFERQRALYPGLRLKDQVKALHQSLLGCGHLIQDEAGSLRRLLQEWEDAPAQAFPEPLSGGFSRLHLGAARAAGLSPKTAQRLFVLSARIVTGQEELFRGALSEIESAVQSGRIPSDAEDRAFLTAYLPEAPRMLSHSEAFRALYRPAYRVISDDCAALLPLFCRIDQTLSSDGRLVLALDGGCAGGKSAAAAILRAVYGAPVIHMDDFFLRPEQRTEERFAAPGGNVDRERFLAEAGPGLRSGTAFSYRRFDCGKMALGETVFVPAAKLIVVEGSYAMHPALSGLYGLSAFVDTGWETRKRRILARNGAGAAAFFERWVPLENRYFEQTDALARCALRLSLPDTPWRVPADQPDGEETA